VSESAGEVRIITTWTGTRRGGAVNYTRTVILKPNARNFEVIDEVTGTAPIAFIYVQVRPPVGVTPESMSAQQGQTSVVLPAVTATKPFFRITSDDAGTTFSVKDGAVGIISATPNRLHMRFSVQNVGLPIAQLQALVPADLINEFNVQAVLLRKDGSFNAREKRLNSLGFTTVAEFGTLVVMRRQGQ
jgi:hypothetical protein